MAHSSSPSPAGSKSRRPRLPFVIVAGALILVALSWLPLVVIARARYSTSTEPRIHIFQDMDNQPKYKAQDASDLFADGRMMRPKIAGTVARGHLQEDDHFYRGFSQQWDQASGKWEVSFHKALPEQVQLTPALLQRGQQQFNIFCATCHGLDGFGKGPVSVRSDELGQPLNPISLHDATVRDRPAGHLYNTINNGIRRMPGYGAQIPVADRWAIVAYVKALQFSQNAPARVLSAERLETLR